MHGTLKPSSPAAVPPVLSSVRALLQSYDVVFCDIWGVVHDGLTVHASAQDALRKFRDDGGIVILVSNAPVPKAQVAKTLDQMSFSRNAWDDIVSSGDIALRHVAEAGYERLYGVGPRDRDSGLFNALSTTLTDVVHEAQAIICSGLNDHMREVAEDYDWLFRAALERRLPLICANPDVIVGVGETYQLCAGALGERYAELGGEVFWAGKPHANAYEAAHTAARAINGMPTAGLKTLVIGDSLRTDLAGARNAGLDALFIAGGIHREETMPGGRIIARKLEDMFSAENAPPAVAAMAQLSW